MIDNHPVVGLITSIAAPFFDQCIEVRTRREMRRVVTSIHLDPQDGVLEKAPDPLRPLRPDRFVHVERDDHEIERTIQLSRQLLRDEIAIRVKVHSVQFVVGSNRVRDPRQPLIHHRLVVMRQTNAASKTHRQRLFNGVVDQFFLQIILSKP